MFQLRKIVPQENQPFELNWVPARELKYLPQQGDNDNDVSRECHTPEECFTPGNNRRHGCCHLCWWDLLKRWKTFRTTPCGWACRFLPCFLLLLGPFLFLIHLLTVGPSVFNKITQFIYQRLKAVESHHVEVYCQSLGPAYDW